MRDAKWITVELGKHIDLLCGFAFKSKEFTDDPKDIPLVKGANVHQGYIDWVDSKYWSRNSADKYSRYFLETDDVVLAMDRPWIEAGLKYSWIRKGNPKALLVQRVARMRGISGLNSKYLRFIIGSQNFTDYIKPIVTGINVPHISADQIKAFKFQLPPKEHQRKIAGILSAYDDLIENNTRRIAILEEMAQKLYKEWFVNFRFPGHENAKFVDSPLGKIPEGWEVVNLFDISEVAYGFPYKSKNFSSDKVGNPVIRIRDIISHKSDTYTAEDAGAKYIVRNGDILIGMDGDFHMCRWAGGEAVLNQRVSRLRTKGQLPQYVVFHCVRGPVSHFNATIVGTTVAHLGDKHLREINVHLPPTHLRNKLHSLFEPLFLEEINLRKKNELLRTTRDLLLPKLISGQLDVEDLDIDTGEPLVESSP